MYVLIPLVSHLTVGGAQAMLYMAVALLPLLSLLLTVVLPFTVITVVGLSLGTALTTKRQGSGANQLMQLPLYCPVATGRVWENSYCFEFSSAWTCP